MGTHVQYCRMFISRLVGQETNIFHLGNDGQQTRSSHGSRQEVVFVMETLTELDKDQRMSPVPELKPELSPRLQTVNLSVVKAGILLSVHLFVH